MDAWPSHSELLIELKTTYKIELLLSLCISPSKMKEPPSPSPSFMSHDTFFPLPFISYFSFDYQVLFLWRS